ncbi:MAG: prolipoprotein diacylglyceryl transferase family protein [Lachnospiraceae bacterium]
MVLYIGTGAAPLRGSFLLAGLVLFWGLGFWQGKKRGFDALTLVLASVLTPLLSVFCAHFFYRLVNLAYDPPAFTELFALWQNGHMLYGGLIGSLLALWCCGGKRALRLMDAYAPSMALMIAFFRLSEGFAGQGYGEYVYEETFLCRFPFMMYDPSYELWAWALFMRGSAGGSGAVCGAAVPQRPARTETAFCCFWGFSPPRRSCWKACAGTSSFAGALSAARSCSAP